MSLFLITCGGGGGGSTGPEEDTTPPTITIQNPLSGSTVSELVNVQINAQDNIGVSRVEILVDDQIIHTLNTTPYTYEFNTSSLTDGNHTLGARAYDTSQNQALAQPVLLIVDNTASRPTKIWLNVYEYNLWGDGSYRSTITVSFDNETVRIDWKESDDIDFQSYRLYKSYSPDMIGAEEVSFSNDSSQRYAVMPRNGNEMYYVQLEVEDNVGLKTLSNVAPITTYYTFYFGERWQTKYGYAIQLGSGNFLHFSNDEVLETLNYSDESNVYVNKSVGLAKYSCRNESNRGDNIESVNATSANFSNGIEGIIDVDKINESLVYFNDDGFHVTDYYGNIIWTIGDFSDGAFWRKNYVKFAEDGGVIAFNENDENRPFIKFDSSGNEEWRVSDFMNSTDWRPNILSLSNSEYLIVFIDSENDNNDVADSNNKTREIKLDSNGNIIFDITKSKQSAGYQKLLQIDNNTIAVVWTDWASATLETILELINLQNHSTINSLVLTNNNTGYHIEDLALLDNGNFALLREIENGNNYNIEIYDSNLNLLRTLTNIVGCDIISGNLKNISQTIDGGFLVSGSKIILKLDPNGEFLQKAIHPEDYGL